jgi:hypothetical protein
MDTERSRLLFDLADRVALENIRKVQPDLAVSVWPDSRLHTAMALSGASHRIGFSMNSRNFYASHLGWRRRQLWLGLIGGVVGRCVVGRRLLTQALDKVSQLQGHLDSWRQLAEAAGVGRQWNVDPPWFSVPPWEAPKDLCQTAAAGGLWMLHPGGRRAVRRWPKERYEQVIRAVFIPQDIPLVIVHPPDSDAPGVNGKSILHYTPKSLEDLMGVVAASQFVLCNDSLVSHLAAAMGKTAVVIMGPMTPSWFGPHGDQHIVIHRTGDCPYHPCLDACRMPSVVCMNAIDVQTVARAIEFLTRQAQAKNGAGG